MSATKICSCITCGKEVVVTKFASAAKVKCDECKKTSTVNDTPYIPNAEIQQAAVKMPRIDGQPNKALRKLACPYHPEEPMLIVGVVKSERGDLVTMQCQHTGCYTLVQISEQQTRPVAVTPSGIGVEPSDVLIKHPWTGKERIFSDIESD